MAFNEQYRRQVTLLMRVLPLVAQENCFALKGGTAINLFVRNMPRLSVDIDLTYLPVQPRAESLAAISAALKRIAERVQQTIRGAKVIEQNFEGNLVKLLVRADGVQIKIDVTPVLRGCVYPPAVKSVSDAVEDEFGYAEIQVTSFQDLYAGKIDAALDRQHPRDFFDVRDLLANEGIDDNLRRAFIVYMLSHHRPMSEVLAPTRKDISNDYARGFVGMTEEDVPLDELLATREILIDQIVGQMPADHRRFLVSFEKGTPEWDLLGGRRGFRCPSRRTAMSGHTARVRAGNDRASLYTEITDKIITELEAGRIPWVQPWGTAAIKAPLAMPRNAVTLRGYSGINVLILWGAVIEHGFSGQSWLTFRQALGLGGHVRKGERGTTVVYADRFTPDDERRRAAEAGEEPGAIPFLKRFTVFNTDQCDGLPEGVAASVVPPPPDQIEPRAEALIAATGADFRIGGARAYYNTAGDFVQVPPPAAYFEPINWHRTAFHELGHWTGEASRLNRDHSGSFGSKSYAREELVAEMGGAFVCASLGIVPTVRHADYIGSWLEVLREDNRAVVRAASAASKAADFLLAFLPPGIDSVVEGNEEAA